MATQWIVFANSSLAKIFAAPLKPPITVQLTHTLEHADSRAKTSDLVQDRTGHYQKGMAGRGAYSPPHMPKELEQIKFAKEIVELLEKNRNNHQFQNLIIIAPSHFYGILLKTMDEPLKKLIIKNIEKDIVEDNNTELKKYITEEFHGQ